LKNLIKEKRDSMVQVNKTVQSISILNYMLLKQGPFSISNIERDLGIGKVGVYRILKSLESAGWVEQESVSGKYKFGNKLNEFCCMVFGQLEITKITLPYLYEISYSTGETPALSLRVGLERIFVQEIPGRNAIHRVMPLGQRFPLWVSSTGKAMLAFLDKAEIEQVLRDAQKLDIKNLASGHIFNLDDLQADIKKIRKSGYAISTAERVPNLRSISAPIFDAQKRVLGAITITGELPRFTLEMAQMYSTVVTNTANKVSAELKK
jgi:IclR family KDG regulon transcriptional repressor